MKESTQRQATMLVVMAHPDDESFGMGGTLAWYAEKGAAVHLICATRGESGEVDPEHMRGYATIAEKREAELRCAAEILGLESLQFLGYRDSGMTGSKHNQNPQALINAPVEEVADKVLTAIQTLKPQVVVTFDPIGGYRHPDHIAMHRASVKAFHASTASRNGGINTCYAPKRLFFYVISKTYLKFAVRIMPLFGQNPKQFGRNHDIDLTSLVKEGDFPIHARVNVKSVEDKKARAAACHASQLGGRISNRGIMNWIARRASGTESFMQAYPEPTKEERSDDLFAGLNVFWGCTG
jgi:LmbE family N-acetylglucosaminyl deacetylase